MHLLRCRAGFSAHLASKIFQLALRRVVAPDLVKRHFPHGFGFGRDLGLNLTLFVPDLRQAASQWRVALERTVNQEPAFATVRLSDPDHEALAMGAQLRSG